VTHSAVQYPAGLAATIAEGHSSSTIAGASAAPKNAKELGARLTELERQIDSSIAYDAVENLVSAHGYDLDESTKPANALAIHQTVQPVIHLSTDGKSATIEARLLKLGGKTGELTSGTYLGRATNSRGVWRLENLTLKQTWTSPFNQWAPELRR
jgi:hypothetical protein